MPKTVLSSKFQEWKGLDRITSICHEMKCIFRELTKDDFGIDGEIEVVVPKSDGQGFETTGGIIKVQAKSGMSYVKQDSTTSFSSPVSKDDLLLWFGANYPTLYIVYHPEDDKLYWKDVQNFVRNTQNVWQPPLKITFDKSTDEFNPTMHESLHILATGTPSIRISYQQKERLFSNLLFIKQLPRIWYAITTEKTRQDVKTKLPGFVPPFTVVGTRLYSLSDLFHESCPLRPFIDTSTIYVIQPLDQFLSDPVHQREYVFMLNQLLGKHLNRIGLVYNREYKRNYFPRRNDEDIEFKQEWYSVRTQRMVRPRNIAKYYKYGYDQFWRHTSVNLEFKVIGNSWYLQITPKYFFTSDGIEPFDSMKVGPYTTRIKAMERNIQMLNHVLFWSDMLSRDKKSGEHQGEIKIWLDGKPVIVIETIPLSGIAPFSIPSDPAIYDEPEADQLSFDVLFSPEQEEDNEYPF